MAVVRAESPLRRCLAEHDVPVPVQQLTNTAGLLNSESERKSQGGFLPTPPKRSTG